MKPVKVVKAVFYSGDLMTTIVEFGDVLVPLFEDGTDAHVILYNEILIGAVALLKCFAVGDVSYSADVMLVVGGPVADTVEADVHHPVL